MEQVSVKMKYALAAESPARREKPGAVRELEEQISKTSEAQVIEKGAYTWFNRFCALRFMDVNRYHLVGVLSPAQGQFQPEILADAKSGHIDEEMVPQKIRQQVFDLLNGKAPSKEPQQEAYRLIIVAVCNYYSKIMPFLFERIDDYTELLMPDDLLSGNSILAYTREAMTPDTCEDVEVIGWLYQFYISEKKNQVFEGLKKNKKIEPENIPAATQLFTPKYIVGYLVENSLGRLWMLNRPNSRLVDKMKYYIKPEQAEKDFLHIQKPEEIKICDPACGSGHMLVYAFELLYSIYEEEGYQPSEIPRKILENNLYGIEIDHRAAELASFALIMKAREKDKRFFSRPVQPNICVLENISFDKGELKAYMDEVGRNLFTDEIYDTLHQFEEADNFGSLIRPIATDVSGVLEKLKSEKVTGRLLISDTHNNVLQVLRSVDFLSPKYHIVISNPPYMGNRSLNADLKVFAGKYFKDSKSELGSMFIERNLKMVLKNGFVSMITMHSWMFLSSSEKLRQNILATKTILAMAHLETNAFDTISGEVVSTTSFILKNSSNPEYQGEYLRLRYGNSEAKKESAIREAIKNPDCGWFFRTSAVDFKKIPGSPIAYWISVKIVDTFDETKLGEDIITEGQNKTADNSKFVRMIWEVDTTHIGEGQKWVVYSKGGEFRKWYGNLENIVDWSDEARFHYRKSPSCRIIDEKFWYREGITWTDITSTAPGFRFLPEGTTYDMAGPTAFFSDDSLIPKYLCLLNSIYVKMLLPVLNPTFHAQLRDIRSIPKMENATTRDELSAFALSAIKISKSDWDLFETSWDFQIMPVFIVGSGQSVLPTDENNDSEESSTKYQSINYPIHKELFETYKKLRSQWREMTLEMQRLEEENNRIFIDAYGLQDELTPEVPLSEITLTCNPHYRYNGDKSEKELESLLLADTMKEFISYAVGCMFGRYSLDKPGLILANQGETLEDYLKQVPEPTFMPDDDNVIPVLAEEWFPDDITERFFKFLRVTFGEQNFDDNLAFLEKAIGKKGRKGPGEVVRDYFIKSFYSDHVKRYKKRPIYWLFSSPKGSFNALIYMHRYRPDTASVVLNDYVREFRNKLNSEKNRQEQISISSASSAGEKTKALKAIDKLKALIREMEEYEREILYPLAVEKKEIDLDDGVKVNYGKFGAALKKIPGLEAKEED